MNSTEAIGNIERYSQMALDAVVTFLPSVLIAIAILIIGFWVIKKINKIAAVALSKTGVPQEITSFFSSFLDIVLKIVVLLLAAGRLGFDATSLVALVAAAGFAVGLALQGFLGNFASGITIVFFRPYKVGDWVQVAEQFGKVEGIQIFNTTLVSPGGKTLIVPNGQVTDNVITNFSTKGHIRLELNVTMPYEESFPRVKKIILEALKEVPNIVNDPAPEVGIESYDSHNVVLAIRPFINPDNYWNATYDTLGRIKKAFSDNGVKVAYSEGVELGPIGE
ncbi:MAG: mechanosensitive ion channel family protein [Saprospiraceae bacterium]